jgi:ADP-ribosylglycohydrolase
LTINYEGAGFPFKNWGGTFMTEYLYVRIRGCLIGVAVGDALGWPVEFDSLAAIRRKYGFAGVTDFVSVPDGWGAVTDDTQMTLFTVEGLLLAREQGLGSNLQVCTNAMHRAYLRWLMTQGETPITGTPPDEGWLLAIPALHARRAPGSTCLSALRNGRPGTITEPINDSKGCGAVMRAAPAGLHAAVLGRDARWAFELGCRLGALTHGHPSGYLPAGCLAALVCSLVQGMALVLALEQMLEFLQLWPDHEETALVIRRAISLSGEYDPSPDIVELLGEGWVGHEALAIGIYCALAARGDFRFGALLAVNHSGDSDSTGCIAGAICGALHGYEGIPAEWLEQVELSDVIIDLADRFGSVEVS